MKAVAATIACALTLGATANADERSALAEELMEAMEMRQTIEKSFTMMKKSSVAWSPFTRAPSA